MIQVASPDGETVAARRDRVGAMVAEARGADLVTLPELWPTGYFAFDAYRAAAEPLHGETVAAAADWARALGAHVHLGSIVEQAADGRLHNTAVLLDPGGRVTHIYRKVHLFGLGSEEPGLLTAGGSVSVTPDGPLGPTGATTCYDLRFPELWRALVDAGAEAVLVPAAWPAARLAHWRVLTTARAVEDQMVIVATSAVGVHGGEEACGHSRVVDPWGEVVVEAGTDEGVTWAEVDPTATGEVRRRFPVLADRRPSSAPIRIEPSAGPAQASAHG